MTSVISVIEIKLGQLPGVIQCVPAPRPPRRDAKRYSNARIELKSHCDGAVPPAVAGATRRITSLARRRASASPRPASLCAGGPRGTVTLERLGIRRGDPSHRRGTDTVALPAATWRGPGPAGPDRRGPGRDVTRLQVQSQLESHNHGAAAFVGPPPSHRLARAGGGRLCQTMSQVDIRGILVTSSRTRDCQLQVSAGAARQLS